MEAKHTPGPWTIGPQGERGTQQLPIWANGKIIAAIRDHGNLSDARLIAAAPDLLAALENILGGSQDFCPPDEVWVAAEKAVAKARGGA